jgi:hypothetical protein
VLPVILAAGSAVVAIVAIVRVLSLRSKLTTLSQSYWDLRYDFARLRARLAKLDGGPAELEPSEGGDPAGVPRV